jgi:hypothetical protein
MEVRKMNNNTVQQHANRALSPERAFVVIFHAANDPNHPPSTGRVEHVSSGKTGHFESWQELIEFVARIVGPAAVNPIV